MKLRKLLYQKCLSQTELAKRTGRTSQMISSVVNGKRNPGPDLRKRIAHVLEIEPAQLFPYREDK